MSARLLRSAATDVRLVAMRLNPMNAAMLGVDVGTTEIVTTLAAAARRIDEASGEGGEVPADEIENIAAAVRELALELPKERRQAPPVIEAFATVQAAIGDLAVAGGVKLPAEPTEHKAAVSDEHQADLARALLGEAAVVIDAVDGVAGGVAAERKAYVQAAAIATDKLRIAADLINAHVPRGNRRVALASAVEWVSGRIARIDQWVRAAGAGPDAAIAGLYANEHHLRDLTGLPAATRVAVGAIDADTTADRLLDGDRRTASATTVGHVGVALAGLLTQLNHAIHIFEADAKGDDTAAPKDQSLADSLVSAAVTLALGMNIEVAFVAALAAKGRDIIKADADAAAGAPEQILTTLVKHGLAAAGAKAPRTTGRLLRRYVEGLMHRFVETQTNIMLRFEDERPALERTHAASLSALAARIDAQAPGITREVMGGYILAWQTLQARAVGGVPEAPTSLSDAFRAPGAASTYDAKDVYPALDLQVPGVLRIEFPISRRNPRASAVRSHSGKIEGISADNLEKLVTITPRPLRDLHLNTIIRVSYDDEVLGLVEIAWRPDGGDIDVAWFRGSMRTHDLTAAHHLKAYALGVPDTSPDVDRATAADALRGARMIADAALASSSADVLPKPKDGAQP